MTRMLEPDEPVVWLPPVVEVVMTVVVFEPVPLVISVVFY